MGIVLGLISAAIYVFFIVMFYRLVRAAEKIADNIEKGIPIRKENTTT